MAILIAIVIAIAIAVGLNKRIEDTLGLSVFLIVSILYISGLFTIFKPGIYLVYLVFLISIVFVAYKVFKNPTCVSRNVLSAGFFAYLAILIYFFFVSYGRYFSQIDDFIHWGIAAKYYYIFSDYTNLEFTSDWASRYPPMSTLWAYFSTKTWKTCSSGMMMWGQQMFIVSLIAPILKKLDHRCGLSLFVVPVFILTIPYWISPISAFGSYVTLMPDVLMGVLFFYIIWNCREYHISKDIFYLVLSAYGCFVITLVKQTGIIHVFLATFVVFMVNAMNQEEVVNNFKQLFLLGCVSLLAYISWNIYTILNSGSVSSSIAYAMFAYFTKTQLIVAVIGAFVLIFFIAISTIRDILLKWYIKYRMHAPEIVFAIILFVLFVMVIRFDYIEHEWTYYFKAFTEFLGDITVVHAGYLIKVPLLVFVFALSFGINYILRDEHYDRIMWNAISISFIMYTAFRCMARVVRTPMEYPTASLGRYLTSGLLIMIIYGFCMTDMYLQFEKKELILLSAIIIFTNTSVIFNSIFDKTKPHDFPALDSVDFDVTDKIFLVDTAIDEDRCELQFMYEAAPALYSGNAYEATWYKGNDLSGRRLTVDEVTAVLNDESINYVYLRNMDEGFEDYYEKLFADKGDIQAEHLYEVLREEKGGSIILKIVN